MVHRKLHGLSGFITILSLTHLTSLPQVKPVDMVEAGGDSAWRNTLEIRPFAGKGVTGKATLVSASSTQEQADWLEALAVAAGLLLFAGSLHHTQEMAFRPMQAVSRSIPVLIYTV